MATTYTSTIKLECWKVHRCIRCGTSFRYRFKRKIVGTANNAEKARVNAQKKAAASLQNDVDTRPCPTCGTVQPDMIGAASAKRHGWVTALAVILVAVLLILGAADVVEMNVMGAAGAGIALVTLLTQVVIGTRDPNRNLDANIQQAREFVERDVMQIMPGSAHTSASPVESASQGRGLSMPAMVLLVLSVSGLGAAEGVRMVSRWPLNSGCYPPVVGGGDKTCVYFPPSITSVAGHWRGERPTVDAGAAIRAESRTDDWGSTIRTKDKTSSFTPWMRIELPRDDQLAGKALPLNLKMTVEYPELEGSKSFQNVTQPRSRTMEVRVAPAGAGRVYSQLSWAGGIAGGVLLMIAGIVMAKRARGLRSEANPTQTMPLEAPAAPSSAPPSQ